MKLYYPSIIDYPKHLRVQLFPLLKPFIKDEGFDDKARQAMYAISEQDIQFVDTIEAADVAILPFAWNYYLKEKKEAQAMQLIAQAHLHKVPVWIIMLDDSGLPIPAFEHTVVFRASGYRSKLPSWHQGVPIFIDDPLQIHFQTSTLNTLAYTDTPIVGFCGLASNNLWEAVKTLVKIGLKKLGFFLRVYPQIPERFIVAPYFRYQCLRVLEKHTAITTNFIMRKRYRAGAVSKAERAESAKAFYNNINQSHYVVCMRGAGNFSVRLYETLAMGRIPIYINTDGLLPLEAIIDWKQHVVWIEADEISQMSEKVLLFHQGLNQERMNALFNANRTLWSTHLRMGTFFKTCYDEL